MIATRIRTAVIVVVVLIAIIAALMLRAKLNSNDEGFKRTPDPGQVLFLATWTGASPTHVLYRVAGVQHEEDYLPGNHWTHQVPLVTGAEYYLSALQITGASHTQLWIIPAKGQSCTANNAPGPDGGDGSITPHCQIVGGA